MNPLSKPQHAVTTGAKLIILLCSIALLVYNVLRIINIPMTIDESGIVSHMPSYYDIVTLRNVSANNHILNTVIRKFLAETFHNTSPFIMRMGNLLALPLFLGSTYLLLRRLFDKPVWIVGGFLFIVLNPFMFEFWGLSRGYGLSMAFMAASVYCFIVYLQDERQRYLWLCQLWAILGVYSNFTILNFYVSLAATIIILPLLFKKSGRLVPVPNRLPALLISAAVLYLLVAGPIQALREHNELYYGGETSLVADTLDSLTKSSFMINYESRFIKALNNLILLVIGIGGAYWTIMYCKHKGDRAKTGVALFLLFLLPVISIYLQHLLLHVKYLLDRTALFLVILFKLQLIYFLYFFSQRKRSIATAGLVLITCVAVINFARLMNITRTWMWWFDSNNVVVLERMLNERTTKAGKIKVRTNGLFIPSFMYYTDSKYASAFYLVDYTDKPITNDTSYQYYYVNREQAAVLKDYVTDTAFGDVFFLMKRKW